MTTKTSASTVAGALAILLAMGGCSGADDGATDATTGPPSPTASPADDASPTDTATPGPGESATPPADETADTPSTGEPFAAPDTVAEAEPAPASMLTVTDIRVARHDTFDRVVFDLSGSGTPGWRVEYVDAALDDGSGLPVDVDGDHVLQVRISGTGIPADTGFDEFSGGPLTLDGDGVEQVVYRFTFEGYSTAFIGTDDRTPFRVFTLTDPTRLVVDVEHDD